MTHFENQIESPSGQDSEARYRRLSILAKVARGVEVGEDVKDFPQIWEDRASALKLLENEPLLLAYAPDTLKDDPEAVATACLTFPGAIESASDRLKNHEAFLIEIGKKISIGRRIGRYMNISVAGFLADAGVSPQTRLRIERAIRESGKPQEVFPPK